MSLDRQHSGKDDRNMILYHIVKTLKTSELVTTIPIHIEKLLKFGLSLISLASVEFSVDVHPWVAARGDLST